MLAAAGLDHTTAVPYGAIRLVREDRMSKRNALLSGVLLGVAIALGWAGTAGAVPAAPVVVTLTQPDGATLQARPYGDERANGLETLDGHTVVQDGDGTWTYAVEDGKGGLAAGGRRPDREGPGSIPPHLRNRPSPASSAAVPRLATSAGSQVATTGTQPTIVILVAFSDQAPVLSVPAQWHDRYFGPARSVSDLYDQASFGALHIVPAQEVSGTADDGVVGWITLPSPHPNTGRVINEADDAVDTAAIAAADPYVDFARFDTRAPFGTLTTDELHVTVVLAGYESSTTWECGKSVWAHRSEPPAAPVDGVLVGGEGVVQVGEVHCPGGPHMATLGVLAHELGHDLGLPDLYDVDHSSDGGVGDWSLMATGMWNALPGEMFGASPVLPDAFSKWYEGWITPQLVVGEVADVAVDEAGTSPRAVEVLDNPGGIDWRPDFWGPSGGVSGTGEYFLVENRQRAGFDAALPGCGLLVWHVDESVTPTDRANADDHHRLVDLVEASGIPDAPSFPTAPWPGSTGAVDFAVDTIPSSRLYDGRSSGASLHVDSSACAPTMQLDVASTGIGPPPSDSLQLDVTGPTDYHNAGTADVVVARDPFGVAGADASATLPSAVPGAGDARIGLDLRRFWIFPIAFGTVYVDDPGAGVNRRLPILFARIEPRGVHVSVRSPWIDTARLPWRAGTFTLSVADYP